MIRPVRDALRRFYHHDGFFLAAGLSFFVVICIIPFLLLLVAAGGYLLSDEMMVREVLDRLATILPVYQPEMERILTGVVEARGVSSLVGTAVLIFFATQLFAATRLVLKRILGTKGRSFVRGVLFDIGMIFVLAVLFFVTVGITAAFAWTKGILMLFERGILVVWLFEWVGLVLAMALDTALFVVLYRFVPNVRPSWSSVLIGSTASAVLWEFAKQLFRLYIERIGVYTVVYGSLGVTIALVMWVYYSAIVFVLGAALIRVLEEHRKAARAV